MSKISNLVKLLKSTELSEKLLVRLKKRLEKSKLKLRLAVIQIGRNYVSDVFISQKKKVAEKVGIYFKLYKFDKKIEKNRLKKKIKKIIENPLNSGIVIQLPLPKQFLADDFLNLIPEKKDVDVLSEKSLGKFYQGKLKILPPTVKGILSLLKNYKIKLKGKNIVIVGTGKLVGLPLSLQLLKEKATLLILNEFTKNISFFTNKADILISGVGKPNLIKSNMIKKGAVVIDAGTSQKNGKITGDIDFRKVSQKTSYISPVPGGVGPMTVISLFENLVELNESNES